jgi:BMFP domain-containing protein YqiC
MQNQNRLFEDLSKVATSAMGTMAGVGREFEDLVRRRVREFVGGMDLVERDEFEAVKASANAAREEVEALRAEIAALKAGKAKPAAKAAK